MDTKEVEFELSEGVTYEVLPESDFTRQTRSIKHGLIKLLPYNQVFTKSFLKRQKKLKDFQCRKDDVWVASFPGCGTTWTVEMVYAIMNDLDYAKSSAKIQEERVPFLELGSLSDLGQEQYPNCPMEKAAAMSTECPRVLKTHLSIDMLPDQIMRKTNKIVYVTRNPRDTVITYYNHFKVLEGYSGSFESFADAFLRDECGYYTPFMQNVRGFWEARQEPNIMFITYEEMKRNLPSVIRKVSVFLGKPVAETDVPALAYFLSFDKMRNNPAMNKQDSVEAVNKEMKQDVDLNFMVEGKTGKWRQHFTTELKRRFQEWESRWLEGCDLKFEYDI